MTSYKNRPKRNERPIGPRSIPDHIFQQKLKYEQDLAELEQKRREFEAEKQEFEARIEAEKVTSGRTAACLLYTSPSPRDRG